MQNVMHFIMNATGVLSQIFDQAKTKIN